MSPGESLYTFNWQDHALVAVLVVVWLALLYSRRAPSIDSVRQFVNLFNSRGGNILVLLWCTIYSFRVAMRLFYHLIELVASGKIDQKDGIVQVAIAFATATVFGMFSGALIKTMTGHEGEYTSPAPTNGNGTNGAPSPAAPPAAPTAAPAAAPAGWPKTGPPVAGEASQGRSDKP